ncbi:hypothetical protein V8E53_000323 [Lactarius tabidus]
MYVMHRHAIATPLAGAVSLADKWLLLVMSLITAAQAPTRPDAPHALDLTRPLRAARKTEVTEFLLFCHVGALPGWAPRPRGYLFSSAEPGIMEFEIFTPTLSTQLGADHYDIGIIKRQLVESLQSSLRVK